MMDESCEKGKLRESDESSANLASLSVIIRIVLIILLRGGFLLVQVGNIAVSNVNLIILHNIVEISWVTICCIIIGSTVGFTGGGGYWRWIVGDDDDYDKTARERVLAVWQSVIVASGIFTNCIAGRMHTVGTLAIGIIFGGLLQPLIIHWGWSINGWMINNPLREANNSSGFIDTGGGALIHATGGVVGLVACLILGRKVDATTSGVDANVASTFVGYFFILIGLQSLTISNLSEVYFTTRDVEIDLTIINNLLSISMCAMVTVGLHFFLRQPFNQMTVMRCIQGMIAGAVVVSAGGSIYPPYVALTLGAINGILFYFTIKFIAQCSFVEDYCNTIAIHLVSGLFGALVVPFFNKADDEFNILNSLLDFSWQIICLLSIIGPIILIMTAVFMSLGCCGLLRNRSEHLSHLRVAAALMATQNSHSRSLVQRLFYPDVQASLMQAGTEPSRDSCSVKHEPSVARLEMSNQGGIIDPNIQHNTAILTVQPELKLRKVRNIHTIRSMDNFENNAPMSIMTTHELHRTFSTMNISEERSIEHVQVKVLVEPRFKSLENSESEEEDIFHQKNSVTGFKYEIDLGASGDQGF